MNHRVVVTGLGAVSSVGTGKENYWRALEAGKNGIDRIRSFDTSDFTVKIAAEISDFDPAVYMPKKEAKRCDRVIQLALAAAKLAVEDSALDVATLDPWRFGVCVGSGQGGIRTCCDGYETLLKEGPRRVSPFMVPMMISNMVSAYCAITYGAKGPCLDLVTACASGLNSLCEAWQILQHGDADVILAGGSEACVTPFGVAGFSAMKALCADHNDDPAGACRPFDAGRSGFVMGEGAGVLVLETLESAVARGAHVYGEITGCGLTCDARHITAPDPEGVGAAKSMEKAMKCSGWESVDLINAHGTSTGLNDAMEARAINLLFGDQTERVLVNATKSMIGHCIGAGGALETIAALQSFEEGIVHKTRNYEIPDPACAIHVVTETLYDQPIERVLVNNFGFGGHNAVLALAKFRQ